jgi:hypothetical protein
VERSFLVPASTLDVMEVDHDLRIFITETPVAQRRGMLPSGREASRAADPARTTLQHRTVPAAGGTPAGRGVDGEIHNVGLLTPGAGIDSSTAMGSDLWAAEALQEAETDVGVGVMIDRDAYAAMRVAGGRTDRLTRRPISALRPES